MTTRRTFLATAASLAAVSAIEKMVPATKQAPSDQSVASQISSSYPVDDFDPNGFYTAVAREADGSLTLTCLVNNSAKERKTFAVDDLDGILRFIDEVGSPRISFIDWHGATGPDGSLVVHELAVDWDNGELPDDLAVAFNECRSRLSCSSVSA